MEMSDVSESEEEERQLLGHYFIYVFIILFKQREHVANGRDHQQVIRHPSKG